MGRQPWAPDDQLTWLEAKVPGFHALQNDETTGKYLDRTEKLSYGLQRVTGKAGGSIWSRRHRSLTAPQRGTSPRPGAELKPAEANVCT